MSSDLVTNFENLFSCEYFYDTLRYGFRGISITTSDNSSLWQNFQSFHLQTNTLTFLFICGFFFASLVYISSLISGLCTWVDKLWSIFPIIYAHHFAIHDYRSSDETTPYSIRLWIVTAFISIWGVRTTLMFYRKGGYTLKFIDQRWIFIQKSILSSKQFFVFNFVFITICQNLLLVLLTLPLFAIHQAKRFESTSLNWIDALATVGLIASITFEHIADNQQWDFYERRRIATENKECLVGDVKRGFLSHGLFRFCRHPNFFGEMCTWWCVYLYSVAATYPIHLQWVNPTIIGTILLTILFQGTTPLTEHLSSSKYPTYQQYQKTTSRLIPMFPGQPLDDLEFKIK